MESVVEELDNIAIVLDIVYIENILIIFFLVGSRSISTQTCVHSTEKVVIDAGYHEYYIYWYNREWMLYASQTQIWREACQ